MAKRFTDTNKYKKPFIRSLQAPYKLLWDYLYHDCDHAGIWIVDFEIAQIFIGNDAPVNRTDALKYFNTDEIRIVEFSDGQKWFVLPFIEFQYGELSESNRAHNSVIQILKKYNLIDKKNKPLTSPLQGAKDMDMDKDMDKDKERGEIKRKDRGFEFENSEQFQDAWQGFEAMRKKMRKPLTDRAINTIFKKLDKISKEHQVNPVKLLDEAIEKSWVTVYEPKQLDKPKPQAGA